MTVKARRPFAASDAAPRTALLGKSPVDRVIVNFSSNVSVQPAPPVSSPGIEEAVRWLNSPEQAGAAAGTVACGDERAG